MMDLKLLRNGRRQLRFTTVHHFRDQIPLLCHYQVVLCDIFFKKVILKVQERIILVIGLARQYILFSCLLVG